MFSVVMDVTITSTIIITSIRTSVCGNALWRSAARIPSQPIFGEESDHCSKNTCHCRLLSSAKFTVSLCCRFAFVDYIDWGPISLSLYIYIYRERDR